MFSTKVDTKSSTFSKLSILIFGSYLYIVAGTATYFFPHTISTFFDLKTIDDIYIRIFGLLAVILGVSYIFMVQQSAILFLKVAIIMRYLTMLFLIYLVNIRISSNSNLLLLELVEGAAATWTTVALWFDFHIIDEKREQLKNNEENEYFYIKFIY